MRRHKTRRTASDINIPCSANIQARPIGRGQPPVHDIPSAMRRHFSFDDFIFARKTKQRFCQFLPVSHRKTKLEEKPRFASASRVRRIKQIMSDFSLRHCGQLGIRQFHYQTKIVWSRPGPTEAMNNFALLNSAIAFKYSRALAGSCLNVFALCVGVCQPSNST